MKQLIYLLIAFAVLACGNDVEEYSFNFDQPEIADGAGNISLRPLWGPGAGGGTRTDYLYSYYCDTINPPKHFVVSAIGRVNIITPESEVLKPNKKYYWKCVASCEGQEGSSKVYSFNTISLDLLNNSWSKSLNIPLADYESRMPSRLYDIDINVGSKFLLGLVTSFTISGDSVTELQIYTGQYANNPYYDGHFSFSTDTVKFIGMKYKFVNFGEYEDGLRNLVLKKFNSDTLLIYEPNN